MAGRSLSVRRRHGDAGDVLAATVTEQCKERINDLTKKVLGMAKSCPEKPCKEGGF
jgi:hypothetical protein